MNLARIRLSKGLSQRDLAEMIGVSQPTIQRAELLDRGSKMGTYIDCAEALGIELSDIFASGRELIISELLARFQVLPESSQAQVLAILEFVESRAENSK